MNKTNKKKLILIGLDNAGKSTILLTMRQQIGPHIFRDLQPTKGLATEKVETEDMIYHVWDFGGQEAYRQKYIERKDYFEDTDTCIFVIDIQDNNRFDLALDYLKQILEIFKDLGENPDFSVFFHKFDPELVDSKEYQQKSSELRKKIRDIFKFHSFSVKVFHTTIYTVFERIQVM